VVLCGSLKLSEELGLMLFENRVVRIIFGTKRDEVMGWWRNLHFGDVLDL
jgi:hypothetical protein